MHQVSSSRKCASSLSQCCNLMMNEISSLMSDKAFPVQIQCMKLCLTNLRRTLNLVKAVIGMTPESGTPLIIQVFNSLSTSYEMLPDTMGSDILRHIHWKYATGSHPDVWQPPAPAFC